MIAPLPREAKLPMLVLRAGLALAGAGIVGFLLSYRQVGAPALASADTHAMPPLAWASILAWFAGMGIALFARWYAVSRAAARADTVAHDDGAAAPGEEE